MIIYKAENKINKKVYIGQTIKTLEERKNQHTQEAKRGNGFRFQDAIARYGEENFIWQIIDEADNVDELNQKEEYWIEYYRSYEKGYNGTKGDSNPMNYPQSKLKHDEIMRSQEVRDKISKTMKQLIADGKMFGEEHRKKISEKMKGNQHFAGHKRTPEAIEACAKSLRKRVRCEDKEGNIIERFDSVRAGARWLYANHCQDLKGWDDLQNRIKESARDKKYYREFIWIYE